MPKPDHGWWHLMWHTYGTWLPGNPRGFRNRDHRVHSSGDYRNPPPPEEHAGLYRYAQRVSGAEVLLNTSLLRERIGLKLVELLNESQHSVLAIAVCKVHVHTLVEFPNEKNAFDGLLTRLKTKSSAAIRDVLPGRVWGRGDTRKLKRDRIAHEKCYDYIRNSQEHGAWVWTYREGFVPVEARVGTITKRKID